MPRAETFGRGTCSCHSPCARVQRRSAPVMNVTAAEKCFNIADPIAFRGCLCEKGITSYCAENVTTSEGTFWEWSRVDDGGKHSSTVKNVVVQRKNYESNATQSWGLFMILMGMFPIGVLFVCFFACNYRRRWVSRSSLSSRSV